ncbi:MAG: AAA family ATPase [Thermoguttaceae bacterium]|nr:AAA family ATPase [Thermoguttaceae bacterium]
MKLETLQITNFRGIHSMNIPFHSKMNVLVGVNGAGKSTVLDALAILLSRFVTLIRNGRNSGKDIAAADISAGREFSALRLHLSEKNQLYAWGVMKSLVKSRKNDPRIDAIFQRSGNEEFQSIRALTASLRESVEETSELCSIPVVIYYQTNRIALNFPRFVHTDRDFSLMSVYSDALSCRADYRVLLEWFRERESIENREFRRLVLEAQESTHPGTDEETSETRKIVEEYRDKKLQTLRNAWRAFMPDLSWFTIRENPLRLEARKNGVPFRIDQLSDGEKSLLALVGDIARRLAIANPTMANPLEGKGIILVDEIDLHFHPRRQRTLIPQLQEVFPNCQFIVATHSPQILGHVHAESIFMLVENEEGVVELRRPEESYGMTTNEILEDIMDVPSRDPDEEGKLLRLFELIERKKLAEAKALIEEIRNYRRSEPKLLAADARIQSIESRMEKKAEE